MLLRCIELYKTALGAASKVCSTAPNPSSRGSSTPSRFYLEYSIQQLVGWAVLHPRKAPHGLQRHKQSHNNLYGNGHLMSNDTLWALCTAGAHTAPLPPCTVCHLSATSKSPYSDKTCMIVQVHVLPHTSAAPDSPYIHSHTHART